MLYGSIAAVAIFALSDPFLEPEFAPELWTLKFPAFVAYGILLWMLRRVRTVEHTVAIGLTLVLGGAVGTSVSGVVTGDVISTQMLSMTGVLITALAVPWGGFAQGIAAVMVTVAMVANVVLVGTAGYPFVAALAIIAVSIIIADVISRGHAGERRLRREIEESQRFLLQMTDQLPALIAYVDTHERYQFTNRAQADWTRLMRAELLHKRIRDIASPEAYALLERHIRAALSGERAAFEIEALSPADEMRCLAGVLEPDIDAAGKVRGFFSLLSDVTDRKRAEELARQHQSELAHVLRVSTMGEMTSALAHELNQPLTAIAAYAASCAAWASESTREGSEIRRSAHLAADEALRAGEIIHRLQRLVRKVEPKYESIDPSALVDHAVALVRAEAHYANIRIVRRVAEDLPEVNVDAIQIEQVLVNLLLNAIQAIERSHERDGVIYVRVEPSPESSLRVRVEDNGPGVAPEARRRIFEPYVTTRSEGLGLGLAISRSIIESHQGRIWIEDNEDESRGATFAFDLPIDAAPGTNQTAAKEG